MSPFVAGKAGTGNLELPVWSEEQNDSFHFACGWNEGPWRAATLARAEVGCLHLSSKAGLRGEPDSEQVLAKSAVTASF